MSQPQSQFPRIVIVGAGMSGLMMGMKLKAEGLSSFTIYEKADAIGGTWRDNTYPGICCDIPSHFYRYENEPKTDWNHRFARGSDIQRYLEAVANKHDLLRFVSFGNAVTAASYRDGQWHVETARGDRVTADVLITACGVLHHPQYPDIEGLTSFAGKAFHTARWDHTAELAGARVGVIGSGASGTQVVPAIVDKVGKLSVFQRTAQWMMPLPDSVYSLRSKSRMQRFRILNRLKYGAFALMFEWSYARAVVGNRFLRSALRFVCQRNLNSNVRDPQLRARLQPTYELGCKRLVISSAFYPAIQKPNAELVDTPIERIEPDGVVTTDGRLHPLDVLILATGFRSHDYMRPMHLAGENGLALAQAWKEGARAFLTVAIPGFPNFFMLLGPGSPVGNYSLIAIAEWQADYILHFVRGIARREIATVKPSEAASARYEEAFKHTMAKTVWLGHCRSWYLDVSGLPDVWPWTIGDFRRRMRRPEPGDFDITPAAPR